MACWPARSAVSVDLHTVPPPSLVVLLGLQIKEKLVARMSADVLLGRLRDGRPRRIIDDDQRFISEERLRHRQGKSVCRARVIAVVEVHADRSPNKIRSRQKPKGVSDVQGQA